MRRGRGSHGGVWGTECVVHLENWVRDSHGGIFEEQGFEPLRTSMRIKDIGSTVRYFVRLSVLCVTCNCVTPLEVDTGGSISTSLHNLTVRFSLLVR